MVKRVTPAGPPGSAPVAARPKAAAAQGHRHHSKGKGGGGQPRVGEVGMDVALGLQAPGGDSVGAAGVGAGQGPHQHGQQGDPQRGQFGGVRFRQVTQAAGQAGQHGLGQRPEHAVAAQQPLVVDPVDLRVRHRDGRARHVYLDPA